MEIVRVLLAAPQLPTLFEPPAAEKSFVTPRKLADQDCRILHISHKLDELRELRHACTVTRGGKVSSTGDPRLETSASLSRMDGRQ